jgi:hypothetical protein
VSTPLAKSHNRWILYTILMPCAYGESQKSRLTQP